MATTPMPSEKSVRAAAELALAGGGSEPIGYFADSFARVASEHRELKEHMPLVDAIRKVEAVAGAQASMLGDPWGGQIDVRSQALSARAVLQAVHGLPSDTAKFAYSINENSEVTWPEETAEEMVNIFRAWVSEAGMVLQIGDEGKAVLYAAKDNVILKDDEGKPVPISPERFRAAIQDKQTGLNQFIAQNSQAVQKATEEQATEQSTKRAGMLRT